MNGVAKLSVCCLKSYVSVYLSLFPKALETSDALKSACLPACHKPTCTKPSTVAHARHSGTAEGETVESQFKIICGEMEVSWGYVKTCLEVSKHTNIKIAGHGVPYLSFGMQNQQVGVCEFKASWCT